MIWTTLIWVLFVQIVIYLNINLSKEKDIGIEYEDKLSEDVEDIIELFHNNIEEDTCMKFVQFLRNVVSLYHCHHFHSIKLSTPSFVVW